MSSLYLKDGALAVKSGEILGGCECCSDQECYQVDIFFPNPEWPGLSVSIGGSIFTYGDYYGVKRGFWQGAPGTGTSPSFVLLNFGTLKPLKVTILCTAMEANEYQQYTLTGADSVEIDRVYPSGAYASGFIDKTSGTIQRADSGVGESRFRLTALAGASGISQVTWAHGATVNQNGMVNAIFACRNTSDRADFVWDPS